MSELGILQESEIRSFPSVRDLVSLTKPGIVMLLLVSTLCPMILANPYNLSFSTILWTLLGGAMMSASANAMNCTWDVDIDAVMKRTQNRPLPTARLSVSTALIFAALLGFSGLYILSVKVNALSALMALLGHVFYVFIYTIYLKRRTAQNIVIGGAAGAFPPLIGWSAATGHINLTAILLFLVVFLWTPPHFWALAIVKNEDYRRAGIPMLPVVAGRSRAIIDSLLYAVLLIPITILLILSDPHLGLFSWVVLNAINVIFIWKIVKLKSDPTDARSMGVFLYSLIYLAVYFGDLVIDALFI